MPGWDRAPLKNLAPSLTPGLAVSLQTLLLGFPCSKYPFSLAFCRERKAGSAWKYKIPFKLFARRNRKAPKAGSEGMSSASGCPGLNVACTRSPVTSAAVASDTSPLPERGSLAIPKPAPRWDPLPPRVRELPAESLLRVPLARPAGLLDLSNTRSVPGTPQPS